MFENILGHEALRRTLQHDISQRRLPGAILLNGPRYNGKSSVALEIARVISCHETARWNCTCHSCRLHRTLEHPNTVMIGPRYFSLEIRAAIDAFRRAPRVGTGYLLIRSVRKLLRRFDTRLWAETKIKSALPIAERLETAVGELERSVELGDAGLSEDQHKKVIAEIEKDAPKLEHALPHDPVPVDLVRALASWARVSSDGYRVAIIEEVHTLQEAARNAMLKILEEPPEDTLFILTSSRRTAIIPTIRSRLRVYDMPERPPAIQADVQSRIFRVDDTFPGMQGFFRWYATDTTDRWERIASDLIDALDSAASTHPIEARIKALLGTSSPRQSAEYFLDGIEEEIRARLRQLDGDGGPGNSEGPGSSERPESSGTNAAGGESVYRRLDRQVLNRWAELIRRYWGRIERRNMNPATVLGSLILAFEDTLSSSTIRHAGSTEE